MAHLLGCAVAGSADFGPDGMRAVYYAKSTDPGAVVARYVESLESGAFAGMGMTPGAVERLEIAGVPVARVRLAVNEEEMLEAMQMSGDDEAAAAGIEMMKAMYGPDGMRLAVAHRGDVVGFVMGGDDEFLRSAVASMEGGRSALPAELERAVASAATGRAGFVMSMDLARLMGSMLALVQRTLGKPVVDLSGQSARVLMHGSIDGRVWSGGMTVDVAALSRMASAMEADGR
jgi:hypothetical protein